MTDTPPTHPTPPSPSSSPLPPVSESPPPPQSFLDQAHDLGISFEADDLTRLSRYLQLVLHTNKSFNLTAITDPLDAWHRHILDSLTLLPVIASLEEPVTTIADVGSGAGLPGLPLAIIMPQVTITMIEATGKKARFIQSVIDDLNLTNAHVLNTRAELAGQDPAHRASYDLTTARAVGKLSIIAELCVPLTRELGHIVLIKGQRADEELDQARKALHMLHARHLGTHDTPSGRIVILDKPRKTPAIYPRPNGEPRKSPLGTSP